VTINPANQDAAVLVADLPGDRHEVNVRHHRLGNEIVPTKMTHEIRDAGFYTDLSQNAVERQRRDALFGAVNWS